MSNGKEEAAKLTAAGKIDARKKYNDIVLEAAINGDTKPPPFEEWVAATFG